MNRKYMAVIVTVVFFFAAGLGIYWLIDMQTTTPADSQIQKQNTQTDKAQNQGKTDTEKNSEETENTDADKKQDTKEDEAETDTLKDQLTGILSDSLQKAINIFVDNETYVTAVGDSLTQGVGDQYDAGGYVGILNRTINDNEKTNHTVTFDNFGKRGNRSDQLIKRLDQEEIQDSIKQADMVLITIGANDVMEVVKQNITNLTLQPFEQERVKYKNRLEDIMEKTETLNDDADIYLIGFYNPFGQYFDNVDEFETILAEWNQTGRRVTEDYDQATFIPVADLFSNADEDLFADDNFHPNYYGYERIANRVLEYTAEQR